MPIAMIAGNWKMNTTLQEATGLTLEIQKSLNDTEGVEIVVCPPFISLEPIKRLLQGSKIALGAQNLYPEEKGAFTGEISPLMLADLCRYVILGHSERRQYFGETYDFINRKVKAAIKAGLKPIMCVGEELSDREAGNAQDIVEEQVREGLKGVESAVDLVVAYEPIWAIGTGRAATAGVAQDMMAHIRNVLSGLFGTDQANEIPLLYGGSCTPENSSEFFQEQDINGALVGGASLNAKSFVEIVRKRTSPTG